MLALWIHEVSAERNTPCWRVVVVVVHLDGHHSFAEVRTLVATIEERHHAGATDFHILFVDGILFHLLRQKALRVVKPLDER